MTTRWSRSPLYCSGSLYCLVCPILSENEQVVGQFLPCISGHPAGRRIAASCCVAASFTPLLSFWGQWRRLLWLHAGDARVRGTVTTIDADCSANSREKKRTKTEDATSAIVGPHFSNLKVAGAY